MAIKDGSATSEYFSDVTLLLKIVVVFYSEIGAASAFKMFYGSFCICVFIIEIELLFAARE